MAGSRGPTKPDQRGTFRVGSAQGLHDNVSKTEKFVAGWPKYKDHDPRLIAEVWKDRPPYRVRTADGTYSVPKGMGMKNRGVLSKDKDSTRVYRERPRQDTAGFSPTAPPLQGGRGSGSSPSGGVKRGK